MKGVSIFLLLTCNLVGICFGGNKDAEFEHAMVNGASVCIRLRVVGDDGEAVGDLHDLVEFVGNEYDRISLIFEVDQFLEKFGSFLRGQHGCRLIQNQNLCPTD